MKKILYGIYHIIFWLWNLVFLLFLYAGLLPKMGVPLMQAVFAGEIRLEFFVNCIGLLLIPSLCTVIGWMRFRQHAPKLMRLLYGVEIPLVLLCLARLFFFRELTPASALFFATAIACAIAFAGELFFGYLGKSSDRNKRLKFIQHLSWLQIVFHSLMPLIGLYFCILLLVPPIFTFNFFYNLWDRALENWFDNNIFSYFVFITFCFSFGLSLVFLNAFPAICAILYTFSGKRMLRAAIAHRGKMLTFSIIFGILTAWISIFIACAQQPQHLAFRLLKNPPSTDIQRQELLRQSKVIRKGLLNAYLFPYRYTSLYGRRNDSEYLSPQENGIGYYEGRTIINEFLHNRLGFPQPFSRGIQDFYNLLISPFLYEGKQSDRDKAQELYGQFFDISLQKRERKAIHKAYRETGFFGDIKVIFKEMRVRLKKQEVNYTEYGDWADVEIHEVYQNQRPYSAGIFYSFSLPESAVITGIWLGETDNLANRIPFKISQLPATQHAHNRSVRIPPRDSALLEQVGPYHYQLKAFLLSKSRQGKNNPDCLKKMHLWLTYRVMRQEQGFALPQLGEKRNIFWTKQTQRFRNGKAIAGFNDKWLEAFLPASPAKSQVHQTTFNGYQITAKPLSDRDYLQPKNQNFAIVVDTSRSMKKHRQKLQNVLQWLQQQGFSDRKLENNEIDLYLTASIGKQPQEYDRLNQFNLKKQVFYGTLSLKEMVQQFDALAGDRAYDAILLLTDEGSYELSKEIEDVPPISAPLWVVHLDGKFPPAYENKILKTIQDSGGGVTTQIPEVLQRIATTKMLQNRTSERVVSVVDGYVWTMAETTNPAEENNSFAPLAARMLVRGLNRESNRDRLAQLDRIHAIAEQYTIVTSYSSAIVLVHEKQRQALPIAESSPDRFKRYVERGRRELPVPEHPFSARIPEPGTIVGLGAIALLFLSRRKILRSNRRS